MSKIAVLNDAEIAQRKITQAMSFIRELDDQYPQLVHEISLAVNDASFRYFKAQLINSGFDSARAAEILSDHLIGKTVNEIKNLKYTAMPLYEAIQRAVK